MTDAAALTTCYEDAVLQRYLMQPRARDEERIAAGWRLFYGVDSNVVSFFLDPHRHAARLADLRRIGLGDLFRLDTLENQHRVAVLVADYPFLTLETGCPLIAIEPVNKEIHGIYNNQTAAFFAAHENGYTEEELARRLDAIVHGKLTPKDRELLEHAVTLEHPAVVAADRIYTLVRNGRILGSNLVTGRTHSNSLARALHISNSAAEVIEFAQVRMKWLRQLTSTGRRPNGRVLNVAAAMARLELCNTRLRDDGVKERLLYITGDSSLLEAAEQIPWGDDDACGSFAAAFIRHPRSFADEPEVLRPSDSETSGESDTLLGWLTLLLGRIDESSPGLRPVGGHVTLPDEVLAMMRQVVADDGAAAERILTEWGRFTTSVSDTGLAPKAFVDHLKAMLHNPDAIEEVERLRRELEAQVELAWTKVFYVSAGARLALEVAAHDSEGAVLPDREVPKVVVEARPALVTFLREAGRWFTPDGDFDHPTYEALRQAVRQEDDTQYGDYVGHAYVLAQQAQWRSAGILAGLASSKVGHILEFLPQRSNGRESAYLQAYCARLVSRSSEELGRAFLFIEKALEIDRTERVCAEASGHAKESASERFEIERLVLRATVALYAWKAGDPEYLRRSFTELLPEIAELAGRVRDKLSGLAARGLEPDHDLTMIEAALVSALGRCLRTSLGIYIQLGEFGEPARKTWLELVGHCAKVEPPSQYTEFVNKIGRSVFAENIGVKARRRDLDRLQYHLPANVLPYDRERYLAMLAIARERLATT